MKLRQIFIISLVLFSNAAFACFNSGSFSGEGCIVRASEPYVGYGEVRVARIGDGQASQALYYFSPYGFVGGENARQSYTSYLPLSTRSQLESAFDIYIIDFYDSDYLQNKGLAAAEAIRNIQEIDGPRSGVALGLSLGGVVARYALVNLEGHDFDHRVRTYISYDSPHTGAHVSPSIMHLFKFIADGFDKYDSNNIWGDTWVYEAIVELPTGVISSFLDRYLVGSAGSPAANQLLISNPNFSGLAFLRSDLLVELNQQGFPDSPKRIAFVNGSDSVNYTYPQDQFWYYDSKNTHHTDWDFTVFSDDVSPHVFDGYMRYPDPRTLDPSHRSTFDRAPSSEAVVLDRNISCSTESFHGIAADAVMSSIGAEYGTREYSANIPATCFIPTLSAMGISSTYYNEGPSDFYSAEVNHTPFDTIYINESNSAHLAMEDFEDELISEVLSRHDLAWMIAVTNILL